MLQSLFSTLITVYCITKAMYVVLFVYLLLKSTFANYYINVLHDISKKYIYGYHISKLIGSEETIQIIILQTICVLLSGCNERLKK